MPLPLIIGALVVAKSTAASIATYAAYGAAGTGTAVGTYVYGPTLYNNALDWLDPSRVPNSRMARKARERMEDRERQVVVDINTAQTALEQRVVETGEALDNLKQNQSVLTASTANLTTLVEDTEEEAQSMRQSISVTEEKLQEFRESLRQKDEELRLINERLQQAQKALADKEALLEQSVKELEDTNVRLSEKVGGLLEAEQTLYTLSVQKNDEADSEWQIVTSNRDTASKVQQQHNNEIAILNAMLANATNQAELLAQENEELKNNIQNLNNNYRTLTNKNNAFSQDYQALMHGKEMLIEKLLEAHETIKSLERKLEAATNPRPSQNLPKFFSN